MTKAKQIPISQYYMGIEDTDECQRCGGFAVEHFLRMGKSGILGYGSPRDCQNFQPLVRKGVTF